MTGMDGAQYKLSCRFEQMSLYTYLFALNLLYSCGIPCFGLDKQSIALGYYFDQMINYKWYSLKASNCSTDKGHFQPKG
jgi:hypothetical protein